MARLPIGLIVFDQTGIIRFDHAASNRLGGVDSAVDRSVFEFMDRDARRELEDFVAHTADDGVDAADLHIEFTTDDGSEATAEISVVPAGQLGEGPRFLMTTQVLEKAEEPRTNPSPLVTRITDVMSDAVWLGSPDLSEIVFVNKVFERVWGHSADELYASPKALLDGIHPDDRDRVLTTLHKHPHDEWSVEFRVVRPEGTERWIEARGFAAVGRAGGKWRAGIGRDITERVMAANELKEHEGFFAQVNKLAGITGWEIDFESGAPAWNDDLAAMLGVPIEKTRLPDVTIDDYIHPSDRLRVTSARDQSSASHEPLELQFRMLTETGSQIHVRTIGVPEWAGGKFARRWGTIQDITDQVEYQTALAQSEELLAETGRTARIGGWSLDAETMEGSWTNTLYDILDLPRGKVPPLDVGLKLCHPDDLPLLSAAFQNAVDNGEPFDLELRGLSPTGRFLHGRVIGQPVVVDGKTTEVWGSAQDITEQVESQAALAKSEALLTETGRIALIGGWELNAETLELSWTDVVYEILDVPQGEPPQFDALLDQYHPQDRPVISAAFQGGLERGESWDLELRVVTARGRLILVRVIGRAETMGGQIVKLRGSLQDTTEQTKLQAELSASENQYRTILDTVPDSIILVDQFGTVTEWNESSATLFGYSADEAIGRPLTEMIIPERHRAAHLAGIEEFGSSGNGPILGDTVEVDAVKSDGSEFPVELRVQRMETGGRRFAVGIIHDITERVESTKNLQGAFVETIEAMTQTIATRDPYTADHQRKVSELSVAIAEELGLSAETVRGIQFGAMIHDIGKISVPAEILNRPGTLSDIEFELIKTHAAVGNTIIGGIDFPWPIAEIVGQHHERIDGSGYPDGLSGSEISNEARIVAVADVVEAMSSHRPYRPSLGMDAALAEIADNRGMLYDSAAVDACLRLFNEHRFAFDSE